MEPHLLYRHLITRCQEFDAVALEVGGEEGTTSGQRDTLVGLLIDVNKSSKLAPFTYTIEVKGHQSHAVVQTGGDGFPCMLRRTSLYI